MMEKVSIELVALFWAAGFVSLMLAKMLFDRFIRTQKSSGDTSPSRNESMASARQMGAGRFSALIGMQGRE